MWAVPVFPGRFTSLWGVLCAFVVVHFIAAIAGHIWVVVAYSTPEAWGRCWWLCVAVIGYVDCRV